MSEQSKNQTETSGKHENKRERQQTGKKKKINLYALLALLLLIFLGKGRLISGNRSDTTDADRAGRITVSLETAETDADKGAKNGDAEHGTDDKAEANRSETAAQEAELLRVTDGDTIWVRIDGEKYKLRMLQINAPESVHDDPKKNSRFGVEASDHLKELLDGVETVWLTRDQSDTDQYGRLLRMVWIEPPADPFSEEEIREKNLNARQILDGYARVVVFDDVSYEELFRKFQREAETEKRGLWADEEWLRYIGRK